MRWLWRWLHMIALRRRQRGLHYLRITAGNNQTGVVLSTLPVALQVQLTDSGGHPVAGQTIQWDFGADGTVDTTSTTDSLGYATATASLGNLAGPQSLRASVQGQSLGVTFTFTATIATPDTISAASAISQSATAGGAVAAPPSVLVVDTSGNPYAGQAVTWAVASGGGSIDATGATTTNASGRATLTSWTLGASVGTNTVTATATGLTGSPVTFSANATASAPTQIAITSGGAQTGITAGSSSSPIVATVRDAGNNPVAGVTVTASTTLGSIAGAPFVTDASGQVAVTVITSTTVGTATVRLEFAKADGSIVFTTTTEATTFGAAAQVVLTTQPGPNCSNGSPLPGQPVVAVQDQYGNTVTSAGGTMTATLASGIGTLTGDTVTIVAGVATYTALTVTGSGSVVFRFSNGTFTVDASVTTAIAPPVPTQIVVTVQPIAVPTGVAVLTFAAIIADNTGTRVPGATGALTAALTTPGGAALSGTTTVNASNGTATWSGLAIDTDGTYTITITDPAGVLASAVTASFAVATQSNTHPNEPVGLTQITENDFNLPYQAGTTAQGLIGVGWYSVAGGVTLVTDQADMTRLTAGAYRITYTVNTKGGQAPCNFGKVFATSEKGTELYVDFDWKEDPNWSGNLSSVNKTMFLTAGGVSGAPFCFSATGAGLATLRVQLRLQACPGGLGGNGVDGSNNVAWDNSAGAVITRGVKYRVEGYFKMNTCTGTVANADGIARVWVDGVQIYNKTNMAFRGDTNVAGANNGLCAPTALWDQIKVNPTYGGGTPNPPYTQFRYLGYLYASTR